jgi:predicted ABC-type sugar transport system permease subunit
VVVSALTPKSRAGLAEGLVTMVTDTPLEKLCRDVFVAMTRVASEGALQGGRGSVIGTLIGALIFGVIIWGFTFLKLDAYYQEMVKGVIIIGAVVLDQWRQKSRARS